MSSGCRTGIKPLDLSHITSKEDMEEKCRETALNRLNRYSQSEKQLRDYLRAKGFEDETIKDCLSMLREYGYLNDRNYACEYYRAHRPKGKSESRILRELKEKGIGKDEAAAAIHEMLEEPEYAGLFKSDRATALSVGAGMLKARLDEGKEADEKFVNRVGRRLLSLGYDNGTCFYVMDKVRKYKPGKDE